MTRPLKLNDLHTSSKKIIKGLTRSLLGGENSVLVLAADIYMSVNSTVGVWGV